MSSKKSVIDSKYEYLSDFISRLPDIFEKEGECIYDRRNCVKVFTIDGLRVNVKRYQIPPYFFNRIVYKLFREPKAVRAYDYASKLLEMGIDTPTPIAYMLYSNSLMLGYSYLVTIQEQFSHDIGELENREISDDELNTLVKFGQFTAKLHNLGIYHKDYRAGNILFNYVDREPIFSLVDINRMDFGEVSMEKGCGNFCRLELSDEMLQIVINAYAEARNFDTDQAIQIAKIAKSRYADKLKLKGLIRCKL